jgi:Putative Na+/H+ antiporter
VSISQVHVDQADAVLPLPLSAYPPAQDNLLATLADRLAIDPFNAVATGIFFLAILHTFSATRFAEWAHRVQHRHDHHEKEAGRRPSPSIAAETLHFLGEVEVIFGLWAIVLAIAVTAGRGWDVAKHYLNDTVNYTEPLFVVVIMALASTRPVITFAESSMRLVANLGQATPAAWWLTILTIGPVLGSFITEPAAMTICAVLLARQFYDLQPSTRLKYATIGLLFVNVSIGGTLTHFAAPPVLMVARVWDWTTPFMMGHFGWRSVLAILASTAIYFALFRTELRALARKQPVPDVERPEKDTQDVQPAALLPVPAWLIAAHMLFIAWTVFNSHYPGLFIGGFLIFLGFARATAVYQSEIELKSPLLVGFFLAGLVIHGGLQGWWIAPVLASLSEERLFFGATILTAFNDNALITYLATLVPEFSESLKVAVVEGAVTGGGLTVIANAPNPAGQSILGRFFGGSVSPIYLLAGALLPTLMSVIAFRLL